MGKCQMCELKEATLQKDISKEGTFNLVYVCDDCFKKPYPKCPICNEFINYLDFDVTGTCRSQMYKENIEEGKYTSFDEDDLTFNAEYDNFSCPECDTILFDKEEEAREFLKNE